MPSFFEDGSLPDFKELRNLLGPDFPWKLAKQMSKRRDGSWMNQFMQDLFGQSGQAKLSGNRGTRLRTETARTSKHLTVSISLPPDIRQRDLRLFASADRLKVSGLPSDRKQIVSFPCLVVPESGRAYWRDGLMIVRFRRRRTTRREVELFIPS